MARGHQQYPGPTVEPRATQIHNGALLIVPLHTPGVAGDNVHSATTSRSARRAPNYGQLSRYPQDRGDVLRQCSGWLEGVSIAPPGQHSAQSERHDIQAKLQAQRAPFDRKISPYGSQALQGEHFCTLPLPNRQANHHRDLDEEVHKSQVGDPGVIHIQRRSSPCAVAQVRAGNNS